MALSKGKQFEKIFEKCWKLSFPASFIYRLNDQVSQYKNSSANPCDYFCVKAHKLFMIECKAHEGNTLPFAAIPQYDRLLQYKDMEDVQPGVLVWFVDHDKIAWIRIQELEKMIKDGKKSINIKMLKEKQYNILKIPSIKKRTFLYCDFTEIVEDM